MEQQIVEPQANEQRKSATELMNEALHRMRLDQLLEDETEVE